MILNSIMRPVLLAGSASAAAAPVRGMATLKDLRLRLRSVTNIQKITKSMKMVAAAKFAKAERELRVARPFGQAAVTFFKEADANLVPQKDTKEHLIIAMTSDRGLCGAVHSNVVRNIRAKVAAHPTGAGHSELRLVPIGDKARSMLYKANRQKILFSVNEIGRRPPLFSDASAVAEELVKYYEAVGEEKAKLSTAAVVHNIFKSVVSYNTVEQPLPVPGSIGITEASKLTLYDGLDENVLRSVAEFSIASTVYFAMKEAATSEQSSRMTAMDSSSKNAGEMIGKLTIQMNRMRQAVITRELVEIIAGAAAV